MQARRFVFAFAALTLLSLAGCMSATVGTQGMTEVPKDAPQTCAKICSDMGTTLSSVVVMASNVGCVCTPAGAGSAGKSEIAASTSGGMAALVVQEEARRRSASSQQQH